MLGMDVLRCLNPEMVLKELAMHRIAYNLIRALMQPVPSHAIRGSFLTLIATEVLGQNRGFQRFEAFVSQGLGVFPSSARKRAKAALAS